MNMDRFFIDLSRVQVGVVEPLNNKQSGAPLSKDNEYLSSLIRASWIGKRKGIIFLKQFIGLLPNSGKMTIWTAWEKRYRSNPPSKTWN
ncbi:hypothetical protein A7E78_06285 [Syntrophotalea acetylenivorans]|uniref:Uncharacterized protein n=1 Tax=Syntrophotalea acetylenivorans TaxID=1842532 RepID=A0A1L3GNG4_9BACT|nr:hypothetical protein A7E78_06285 [Syntrophotalea acetylenivorans]